MEEVSAQDKKKLKRKLTAQNKASAIKLLAQHWPGFKHRRDIKNYALSLASSEAFSAEWFIKKMDRRLGKHVRTGSVYKPGEVSTYAKLKEQREYLRPTKAHNEEVLSADKASERAKNISSGIPYTDMTPFEQGLLKAALMSKPLTSYSAETSASDNGLSEKSKRLKSLTGHLTNTDTRQWLASIPEIERTAFASWCVRKNYVPIQKYWEEYVSASLVNLAESSVQDYAAAKNKLKKAGWTDAEMEVIGNGRLYTEYRAENARQKLNNPHFVKRESENSHTYSRVKVRKAQGLFRADVLRNWGDKCAITGTRLALEAAHILSHSKGGAPSVENGICLAADLHTLLDRGHIRFEDGRVVLSIEASADERYAPLDGCSLRKPLVAVNLIPE